MRHVWVVTSVELGWDCVVGVFTPGELTKAELEERFPQKIGYVIHEQGLYTDLEDFD